MGGKILAAAERGQFLAFFLSSSPVFLYHELCQSPSFLHSLVHRSFRSAEVSLVFLQLILIFVDG